jgi:hypothetical protein
MSKKFFSAVLISLCLLAASVSVAAQQKKKPETISTPAKLVVTKLKVSEGEAYEVRGKAVFTLVAANSDDSVAGTLTYTIPDDARQKVAQITGKPLSSIPASVTAKDVVAEFQKATACPTVHLEFKPMDVDIAGVKNHFNRFVLDIDEKQPGASKGTQDLATLFCVWTEQINAGRARRGMIRAMNQILNGAEQEAN